MPDPAEHIELDGVTVILDGDEARTDVRRWRATIGTELFDAIVEATLLNIPPNRWRVVPVRVLDIDMGVTISSSATSWGPCITQTGGQKWGLTFEADCVSPPGGHPVFRVRRIRGAWRPSATEGIITVT